MSLTKDNEENLDEWRNLRRDFKMPCGLLVEGTLLVIHLDSHFHSHFLYLFWCGMFIPSWFLKFKKTRRKKNDIFVRKHVKCSMEVCDFFLNYYFALTFWWNENTWFFLCKRLWFYFIGFFLPKRMVAIAM